jgi:hypothetical protein
MLDTHVHVAALELFREGERPLRLSAAAVDSHPAAVQLRQVKLPPIQHSLTGMAFVVVRYVTLIGIVAKERAQATPGRSCHSRGDFHASRVAT